MQHRTSSGPEDPLSKYPQEGSLPMSDYGHGPRSYRHDLDTPRLTLRKWLGVIFGLIVVIVLLYFGLNHLPPSVEPQDEMTVTRNELGE